MVMNEAFRIDMNRELGMSGKLIDDKGALSCSNEVRLWIPNG
jgi:hypothetical protein